MKLCKHLELLTVQFPPILNLKKIQVLMKMLFTVCFNASYALKTMTGLVWYCSHTPVNVYFLMSTSSEIVGKAQGSTASQNKTNQALVKMG